MTLFDENIDTKVNCCMEFLGAKEFANELMRALPDNFLGEIVDFILQTNYDDIIETGIYENS